MILKVGPHLRDLEIRRLLQRDNEQRILSLSVNLVGREEQAQDPVIDCQCTSKVRDLNLVRDL